MARVADTETAMRSMGAPPPAPPRNNQPPPCSCPSRQQVCFTAAQLVFIVLGFTVLVMCQRPLPPYENPQFKLKSLKASQPSALVLGDRVVVSGWVVCFSTRNHNPEPISYRQVAALMWAHRGRRFDEAAVTPFVQPPWGADEVCASFPGTAMETDKTVWFDALRLDANITYKSDKASMYVYCKDVKVVVSSAAATELKGGARECMVTRISWFPSGKVIHVNPLSIALWVMLGITGLIFNTIFLCYCVVPKR